jgi:sporulation protein YhbH
MSVDRPTFTTTITQSDWSLHRKGSIDQSRHQEKVNEVIRGQLPGILSDESMIGADGKKIIKVPIRSLELPRFRFNQKGKPQAGQGNGDSKVGDIIGQQGQPGPGKGGEPGEIPGIDYYEAEYTVDQLTEMVFADLGLPFLLPKETPKLIDTETRFDDVRRTGPMSNLDKKRTLRNTLIRNAIQTGKATLKPGIKTDDLRFKTWTDKEKPTSDAAVIAMRDVSGSMGEFEKYVTRAAYMWITRFLRTKYDNVEMVFLTHHTTAKEVDEATFFGLGESGGTKVSPVYQEALKIADERFPKSRYNLYPFHFTDGDNEYSDNTKAAGLVEELLERSNQFGYADVKEGGRTTPAGLSAALG